MKKSPSIAILIFNNQADGISGYELLLDSNKKSNQITLIAKINNNKLDLSVVSKDTADAINIKNLKYDKIQLSDFLKNNDFAFAIGILNHDNQPLVIATREDKAFLTIENFSIIS